MIQEVCLAAIEQRFPLADPTKDAPWLYRVAVSQSLLYRRKQGRARKLTRNYAKAKESAGQDSREYDPLDWLLADERRQLVRTALSKLSRPDAEILSLKYTKDWSYRQLADHLGVSRDAVQARLHRARQRLRRELAALEATGEGSSDLNTCGVGIATRPKPR